MTIITIDLENWMSLRPVNVINRWWMTVRRITVEAGSSCGSVYLMFKGFKDSFLLGLVLINFLSALFVSAWWFIYFFSICLFVCTPGSFCGWTTMAQPSTSWFYPTATTKPSSWRSSTDRWRSTQTSSVSLFLEMCFPFAVFAWGLSCFLFVLFCLIMRSFHCCFMAGGFCVHQVLRRRRRTIRASLCTLREKRNTCRLASSFKSVDSTAE